MNIECDLGRESRAQPEPLHLRNIDLSIFLGRVYLTPYHR